MFEQLFSLAVTELPVIAVGAVALTALLFGAIVGRLGFSPLAGYLLAGLALGPLGLKLLAPSEGLSLVLWELGLLLLFFYLGLEASRAVFRKGGATAFVVVLLEVAAVSVAGFAVSKLFGLPDFDALAVGGILAFSSTLAAVKLIADNKWAGKGVVFSALVAQDVLAVTAFVFLASFAAHHALQAAALFSLLFLVLFLIVSRLSNVIAGLFGGSADASAAYAILAGVVAGYFSGLVGLPVALGAYFAGFALSETPYGERIKRDLGLFRESFVLLLFVVFGASVVMPSPVVFPLFAVLLLAYVAVKLAAYGVFGTAAGLNANAAAATGLLLLPLGEFSVLLVAAAAPLAASAGDLFSLAFLLVVSTNFLVPALSGRIALRLDAPKSLKRAFAKAGLSFPSPVASVAGASFKPIHEERLRLREQVRKALAEGDSAKARFLLSASKKRERALASGGRPVRETWKSLENYFVVQGVKGLREEFGKKKKSKATAAVRKNVLKKPVGKGRFAAKRK